MSRLRFRYMPIDWESVQVVLGAIQRLGGGTLELPAGEFFFAATVDIEGKDFTW